MLLEHRTLGSVSELSPKGPTPAVRLPTSADAEASRVDVVAFGAGWCIDRIGISDVRSANTRDTAHVLFVSTATSLRTRSPAATAKNGYCSASPFRPNINIAGTAQRWSTTQFAGWRAGECSVLSSTRMSATTLRCGCTTASGFTDLEDRLHVYERRIE
jgi:hypothetical protein